MKKKVLAITLAAVLVLSLGLVFAGPVAAVPTNLVGNGGFEAPTLPDNWECYPTGTTGLVWTVDMRSGGSSLHGLELQQIWTASEGNQYAELDGYEPDTIYQNLVTVTDGVYLLSFAFSPRPDTTEAPSPIEDNKLEVKWDSVIVDDTIEDTGVGKTDTDWTYYSYLVQASGTSTELRFTDLGAVQLPEGEGGRGTFLDDVSVIGPIEIVSLTPLVYFNPVDTEHTVTATVKIGGDPVPAIEVGFVVTGANTDSQAPSPTDASGQVTFSYTGTNDGMDTIRAYIDVDGSDSYDAGEPYLEVTKYWLEHFVTGGGMILEGRGKDAYKITFGGNVGFDLAGNEVGQWNINIHNVSDADFDKGHFHTTQITEILFSNVPDCPEPDPPDADYNYAHFVAMGKFNGVPGWKVRFNMTDYGEGNKDEPDGIRIRLYRPGETTPCFDTSETGSPNGDFPNEGTCAVAWRTRLDGGNIQIHPPALP